MRKCTDPSIGKQVLRDEPADELLKAKVKQHLAVCKSCASDLLEYERASSVLKQEGKVHPTGEELFDYASTHRVGEISSTQRLTIQHHLLICADCRRYVQDVTATDKYFEEEPPAQQLPTDQQTKAFMEKVRARFGGLSAMELESLSQKLQDKRLNGFDNNKADIPEKLSGGSTQGVHPSKKVSWSIRRWSPSINAARVAAGLLLVGGAILIGILWKLSHQTQVAVVPTDHANHEFASPTPAAKQEIVLKDVGGVIRLDSEGNLQGIPADLSRTNFEAIQNALKEQQLFIRQRPRELQTRSEQRMGTSDSPAFTLLSPAQTIILSTTPTFKWNALKDATNYTVSIYDDRGNLVLTSPPVRATEWRVPQTKPLVRGKIYSWEVTAVKAGEEITSNTSAANAVNGLEAKFKVLEQSHANEIFEARQRNQDFHLLLGIIYARVGLVDEAEIEFRKLLAANPESKVAQQLVNSLRANVRRSS